MKKRLCQLLVGVSMILVGCTPAIDIASTPTQSILITPSPSSSPDARATQIVLSRTREAEARIHQTQTGPVPTATFTRRPPTRTPEPTWTPWLTITPVPSPSSTPQPPLQAHTFPVHTVLASLWIGGGDGAFVENPPEMLLYGDGLLVVRSTKHETSWNLDGQLKGRILSRQEICRLLNTIDQSGFFDYDPASFGELMTDGASSGNIAVNAWRTNSTGQQYLWKWVYEGTDWYVEECRINQSECIPPPTILPALSSTYKLLNEYDPGGLQPLPVESLLIWLVDPWSDEPGKTWPIETPSLHQLYTMNDPEREYLALEIEEPAWVEQLNHLVSSGI